MRRFTKLLCAFLCTILIVALSAAAIVSAETPQSPFDVSGLYFSETYFDDFDGKTQEEIYAEWNGVVKSLRPQPVTADGWLTADWDTNTGVGYSFKQAYRNARYDFDVKYEPNGSTSHATVVFRAVSGAGNFYGGMQSGSTSGNVNGVAFSYYNSSAQAGSMTISVADSAGEVMKDRAVFELPYPEGIDFKESTHVTAYDLDDRLLFFVENQPFAAVVFDGLSGDLYTEGKVYGAGGELLGGFQKTVRRESNFAITARYSTVYLDNFSLAKLPASIVSVDSIETSVVFGTSYAQVLNKLPNRVMAEFDSGEKGYMDIEWELSSSDYNGSAAGRYEIKGKLSSDAFLTDGEGTVTAYVNVLEEMQPIEGGENVLYQYMPFVDQLHMGYILRTKTGKLIVIDGGWVQNHPEEGLLNELKKISGSDHPVVDAWILTHLHADHVSEFIRIANEDAENITVKNVYMHFPSKEQAYRLEKPNQNDDLYNRFTAAYDKLMGEGAYEAYQPMQRGDVIVVDDIVVEILQVPDGTEPSMNDTSMPFRMTVDGQSILFLGDLAAKGGERLYADWGSKLKSDIVQMAHHGQVGVNENVYQMIDPDICLWPTPIWVWDCQEGGPYRTWETKEWMAKLDVKRHIVAGIEGTLALRFPLDLETYQPAEIIGVNYVSNIYVRKGDSLPALPENVTVLDNLLNERTVGVEWATGDVDTAAAGEYVLKGRLILGDELLQNSQGFTASVRVVVYDDGSATLIDFESGLKDFDSYYIADTAASMQGVPRDAAENWTIENGQLIRINDLGGNDGGTNRVAVLTYTGQTFRNFTLSVDVKMGEDSIWWPVVTILQRENNGSYFLADGLGLFIQQSGVATVWGEGTGNPIEGKSISGYKNNAMHNITVTVLNGHLSFYVDGALALEVEIPSGTASEGYISLMSVNNGSMFANLVLREIPESDISRLQEVVARAEGLDEEDFFQGWKALQEALIRAKQLTAFDAQAEIDAACEALEAAMEALLPVGNPEELRLAVEEGLALSSDDYTQASYDVFAASLKAAEKLLEYPTSQEILDASLKAVAAARQALIPLADRESLTELIKECSEIQRDQFTEESWTVFAEALAEAEIVADKEDASREEINAAVQALRSAREALEAIEQSCQSTPAAGMSLAFVVLLLSAAVIKRKF